MEEKRKNKPCCAADALRQVRRVNVGGTVIGFTMLDAVFAEVAAMEIRNTAAEKGVGNSVRANGIHATAGMMPVILRTG